MLLLLITTTLIKITLTFRNITLHGNVTLGYYYMDVYIGNPLQKQSLIFDTGSHETIFPCEDCKNCGKHINKNFKGSESKTFKKLKIGRKYFGWTCQEKNRVNKICKFSQRYGEGSLYVGYLGEDELRFKKKYDSEIKFKNIFGCATKESSKFKNQKVNGIIGFGFNDNQNSMSKILNKKPPTLLEIYKKYNINKKIKFSICISKNGGKLNFDTWNKDLHLKSSEKKYIKNTGKRWTNQYSVALTDIKIDKESLDYNFEETLLKTGHNTIFDSGTTWVYLNHSLFFKFQLTFKSHCAQSKKKCNQTGKYKPCYTYNKKILTLKKFYESFPTFKFYFNNNIEFEWTPNNYLSTENANKGVYCVSVQPMSRNVLGAVFSRNYDILYDYSDQIIGFVKANCGQDFEGFWERNGKYGYFPFSMFFYVFLGFFVVWGVVWTNRKFGDQKILEIAN